MLPSWDALRKSFFFNIYNDPPPTPLVELRNSTSGSVIYISPEYFSYTQNALRSSSLQFPLTATLFLSQAIEPVHEVGHQR
jgi:hypothetical protein